MIFFQLPISSRFQQLPLQEVTYHLGDIAIEDVFITPETVLQKFFGHTTFRSGQLEGVQTVLNNNDLIVLIPTGGGKTVIYAVVSLLLSGLTVVVSPLLMLMYDQLLRLREKGINNCYINTLLSPEGREAVIANISRQDCEYKILITGPEIILSPQLKKVDEKATSGKKVKLLCHP